VEIRIDTTGAVTALRPLARAPVGDRALASRPMVRPLGQTSQDSRSATVCDASVGLDVVV
jgi:hypothetical protein